MTIVQHSLVLYKTRPARVLQVADKLEIESISGDTHRVRLKDVCLLHEGPIRSLKELAVPAADWLEEREQAWELLAGGTTTLIELTELVFGQASPAHAWAVWQWVQEDLHCYGKPDLITMRKASELAALQQQRQAKADAKQEWQDFIARLKRNSFIEADRPALAAVELLALGQASNNNSPILRDLNRDATPQNAHALLLKIGYWAKTNNPYPHRLGIPLDSPVLAVPALDLDEPRRDLTHLLAYAIDDEGNQDPDDAISLELDTIWVHVADVAAVVPVDSELDLLARSRVANLYLPELTSTMLPVALTEQLGLGLQNPSPALSFHLRLDAAGEVHLLEVVPSWIQVTRISYAEAEQQLQQSPLAELYADSQRYHNKRLQQGAIQLNLPEVKVKVTPPHQVSISQYPELKSRELVMEMMLMTGEAVAQFALEHQIPLAFSTQAMPEITTRPTTLAEMYGFRKQLKRSQFKGAPLLHAGLGLTHYVQVTSPLRRYLDLVAHQQLRAFIRQQPLLTEADILERIGRVEALAGSVRRAERLSNQHWTLVYLNRQRDWTGQGIIVEDKGHNQRVTLLIPEFALETTLNLKQPPVLDQPIPIQVVGIDLPELMAYFRVL